jgi:hypothetical protein
MDRTLTLAVSALLFVESARADLQLTPTLTEYELDGVKLQHLVFPDGGQRVMYTPPRGWKYVGGDNLLVLHPPEARAEATIARTSLSREAMFDEATSKLLTDEVVASARGEGKNVTIVSQEKNPLLIERKETLLVIIKYDFNGKPYLRSVMFLNRKKEQLRLQLTAPQENFASLQETVRRSYFSWQNL